MSIPLMITFAFLIALVPMSVFIGLAPIFWGYKKEEEHKVKMIAIVVMISSTSLGLILFELFV